EVSPYVVMTKEDQKLFIGSPNLYPTIALVDPLLTVTMPKKVTASTGLDALSHAVEGFTARPAPFSDAMATKAVEYTFEYLEKACEDGDNLEARFYMSYASVLGMMAYIQGGGLYAHSCSYILTLYNNTPHGIGCGVALPHTLMFNLDFIRDTLAKYARTVDPDIRGTGKELSVAMVEKFFQLLDRVEAPSSLRELGVPEKMIPNFAKELMGKYYRIKNPRPMNESEALKFVKLMWEGRLERF
ncbi:MAG: iron-containing alcohol dehydrogenase, partial [Desulfobacterales bacterium]